MARILFRLSLALLLSALLLPAANLGTVVNIVGSAADLVYDSQRNLVYISNTPQNRIEVYSVSQGRLLTPISVGNTPAGLTISRDKQTLFVANNLTQGTVSLIDLTTQALRDDIPVNARPDAIAVGNDGQVLIVGSLGLQRLDPVARTVTPVGGGIPVAIPPGANTTPPGFHGVVTATTDGRLIFGYSTNRVFIYEVASGTVLNSRTVGALNASASAAPNGSRFMIGPFLFDARDLSILGRAGLPAGNLTGGSVFSLDGNSVYATFSNQTPINPSNTNNPQVSANVPPGAVRSFGVLQQMKATNLAPRLGLRLADNITGRAILSDDGQNLFALSSSGMIAIPIGRLNTLPILTLDQPRLLLSADICNRGVQSAPVRISNAGAGRMTFQTLPPTNVGLPNVPANQLPTAVVTAGTGVAPASLNVTFDPRSVLTAVIRNTSQANIVVLSPEAVNIEPTIAASLNFRDVDQRGTIVPMTGTFTDILADPSRNRLYITDSLNNQVQVFDTAKQVFLPAVEVGAQPKSMAMVGSTLLLVANSASENISVVDLTTLQQVQLISLAPFAPAVQSLLFPSSIAASNNAVIFTTIPPTPAGAIPGNGNVWQVSLAAGTAFPRPDLVGTAVDGRAVVVSAGNGAGLVVVSSTNPAGGALRFYDPSTDAFPLTKTGVFTGANAAFRGAVSAAPDGSYYVIDSAVYNSTLGLAGNIAANPAGTLTQAIAGGSPAQIIRVRTGAANGTDTRQTLERLAAATLLVNQSSPLDESMVNAPPGNNVNLLLPRGMAIDSPTGNAYVLTTSGMTVIPLTVASGAAPTFNPNGVVNGASFAPGAPVAPGSIISLFGTNLGDTASATDLPLATVLGGTCITINDIGMPLFYVSPTQVNAQLPPNTAAGRVTLTARNRNSGRVGNAFTLTVTPSAPGIFLATDNMNRQVAAIFHASNNTLVTQDNQAFRDEVLTMYVTGLGATTPTVAAGVGAPASPPAVTTVAPQVCIGKHPDGTLHKYIPNFGGLAPGFVGLYQINFTVPGDRVQNLQAPVVVTQNTDCTTANSTGAPTTAIR